MKKFIFVMIAMFTMSAVAFAQEQTNYSGSSKFTDNWSVTLQGGTLTTFNDFYAGHTAVTPIVVLGADKYINPWFGVGVEGRTLIGTGHGKFNTHTAFDAVNVNGYAKFNVRNMFNYDGNRKMFEPVVYTGLGWGHQTANQFNYMTYRAGAEMNFNLGKEKVWAVVVNPSVVWGDINNGKLIKSHGNFEFTAGLVYHFKTSNGSRSIKKARLYDASEVATLTKRVSDLENREPVQVIKEVVKEVQVTNAASTLVTTWTVPFAFDSAELTDEAKAVLNGVATNVLVNVDGYATCEPKTNPKYNHKLTVKRAQKVAEYLNNRGVRVNTVVGHGSTKFSNRVVVVTVVD